METDIEQEIDWQQELYGGGYLRMDRERHRKRKVDFWTGLEGISPGVALMVDWECMFGSTLDVIRPFLELTGERTETFPCPAVSPCGCRHSIRETRRGEWIAACCCEWDCGTYQIEPADILFHGINVERLGGAVRRALGFAEPSAAAYASRGLREVGTYAEVAAPVYLSMEGTNGLLRELTKLLGLRDGPFLVLTPTGSSWSAEVEALARPRAGGHVALASVLECRVQNEECRMGTATKWEFRARETVQPMLAEFARRVASLRDAGGTLRSIHREIAAVAKGTYELARENEDLRKLQQEGLFKFALRVDAEDFRAFAVIMALGNRKAAADFLKVPHRSFYDRVEKWTSRGKEYERLYRLVEWRKKVGRKIMVRLEDSVQSGEPNENAENPQTVVALMDRITQGDNRDYPGILREILETLEQQTPRNWAAVRDEVVGIIREEVPA